MTDHRAKAERLLDEYGPSPDGDDTDVALWSATVHAILDLAAAVRGSNS